MPATAESLDRLNALAADGFEECWVPLFGAGHHRDGEPPYNRKHVRREILRNFKDFSAGDGPPLPVNLGLGHYASDTAEPTFGRVRDLREAPGGVLEALVRLPRRVAAAVKNGFYFRVSAEVNGPRGKVPTRGCALTGVALLGRTHPQLHWTGHLDRLLGAAYAAAPRPAGYRYSAVKTATGFRTFAEAIMPDALAAPPRERAEKITLLLDRFPDLDRADLEQSSDADLTRLGADKGAWKAPEGAGPKKGRKADEPPPDDDPDADDDADTPTDADDDADDGGDPGDESATAAAVPAGQYAALTRRLARLEREFDGRVVRATRKAYAAVVAPERKRAKIEAAVRRWKESGAWTGADEDGGDPDDPCTLEVLNDQSDLPPKGGQYAAGKAGKTPLDKMIALLDREMGRRARGGAYAAGDTLATPLHLSDPDAAAERDAAAYAAERNKYLAARTD